MTTKVRHTPKGLIVEADGYNSYYGAMVQGAIVCTVFVPQAFADQIDPDDPLTTVTHMIHERDFHAANPYPGLRVIHWSHVE